MINKIEGLFLKKEGQQINKQSELISKGIVLIVVVGILKFSFSSLDYPYNWSGIIDEYWYKFGVGFYMTIVISFFSLFASLFVGSLLVMGQKTKVLPIYYFSKGFTEVVRGTPLIVQIYIFYYVIGTAFNIENRYVMGVIIMAIFSGAYVGEIIRAGIESIEKIQLETAKALALTKYQTYRYIIFPQVIKRVMPPLAGQFASLIKDSSLLSIIAVNEFTKNVQEVDSLTFSPIENYCILAIGYLIITFPISYLSKYLEKRFSYGN